MSYSNVYKEALLVHAKNPKNLGYLDYPDFKASSHNPLCGDELELYIKLNKGKISDCKTKVRGCSISLISASMMSELIKLKTPKDAEIIRQDFLECLKKSNCNVPENLEYLLPLISLKSYKSRVKCICLAWDALNDCLMQYKK